MSRIGLRFHGLHIGLVGLLLLGGCAIDVDLTSTPSAVPLSGTVNFDISVRNRTTCPVGGVVALLFPFIPRDLIINEIEDEDLREELSDVVDAFCTGEDVEFPDGAAECRLEDGELFCELDPRIVLPGPIASAAVSSTTSGDDVTCSSDGEKITCRFPRRIVELAMSQQVTEESLGDLQCIAGDNVAACGALLLDPNETKSDSVEMQVNRPGILRNWVISFATRRGGVCANGFRRIPCDDDSQCSGVNNFCGSGICEGGTDEGRGCDTDGDCAGNGTCIDCEVPDDDDQLLSGIACTTTASQVNAAPALSPWGALAVISALLGIGGSALRRGRRN